MRNGTVLFRVVEENVIEVALYLELKEGMHFSGKPVAVK